jgi:hypothetical protein
MSSFHELTFVETMVLGLFCIAVLVAITTFLMLLSRALVGEAHGPDPEAWIEQPSRTKSDPNPSDRRRFSWRATGEVAANWDPEGCQAHPQHDDEIISIIESTTPSNAERRFRSAFAMMAPSRRERMLTSAMRRLGTKDRVAAMIHLLDERARGR